MILSGTPQFAFFGDSLTDNGNLFRVSEGLVDDAFRIAETGWNGRISNGPTYAEHIAPLLGLAPSLNYAIASAEALGPQTLRDYAISAGQQDKIIVPLDDPDLLFDMNLGGQIDRFAQDTAGEDRSNVKAFVLIGANDYGGAGLADLTETMLRIVGRTLDLASELEALGVDEVIVSGLPAARFLPSFAELPPDLLDAAETLLDSHNGILESGVDVLRLFGGSVRFLDLAPYTEAIADDPDQFGILAPWGLTLRDGDPAQVALYDADQVGFWDSIHATGATHGVLGSLIAHADRAVVLGGRGNTRDTGDGDDLVLANAGQDTIDAGLGEDRVFLGRGDDFAWLRAGRDMGSGGSGDDTILGGAGADVLAGGSGNDLLKGQKGNDVLIDGLGDDTLRGGAHDDLFIFFEDGLLGGADAGTNRMTGGNGSDRLILVLGDEAAESYSAAASRKAGLALLGIAAVGIETVDVVSGRAGLDTALAAEHWFGEADLWGLV